MMSSKRSGLRRRKLSRMPGTFQLEHADRIAARKQLVGRPVIERERPDVEIDTAPLQEFDRLDDDGQRLEPQEVELNEAGGLDPFHVELRRRQRRARIAIKRHELR